MFTAGLGAAVALAAEHYALRHRSVKLAPEIAYIVGTTTMGAAFGAWAIREGEYRALAAAITVAAMGGSAVVGCYWLDRRIEAARQDGFKQGRIVGEAMGYAAPTEGRRDAGE